MIILGALEGERKLVAVLFVDVVGSTSLAEHRDPEHGRPWIALAVAFKIAAGRKP